MAGIDIVDLEAPYGAEVRNFDPSGELDSETQRVLRETFNRRQILIFRDVEIDYPRQARLTEMLAGIESDEDIPGYLADQDEVAPNLFVSNAQEGAVSQFGRLLFHSDMMWADSPLEALSLYATEMEEPSVPTMFASTANAWATLPEDLRNSVAGLSAYHSAGQYKRDPDDDIVESLPESPKSTVAPIARPHARSGGTLLYVSEQVTRHIVDVPPETSEHLLRVLMTHLYAPENVMYHNWRKHDLVIWDNLAVQHARPNVAEGGSVRTLRRFVCPLGDIPEQYRSFRYRPISN
jgi:taurine dioxygenase